VAAVSWTARERRPPSPAGRRRCGSSSNWTRRPLSPEQLAYAAADVEVLIALEPLLRQSLPLFERV
jgi:hypothetical protein